MTDAELIADAIQNVGGVIFIVGIIIAIFCSPS